MCFETKYCAIIYIVLRILNHYIFYSKLNIMKTTTQDTLSFQDTAKLVGDAWTLRVIDAVAQTEQRFSELERYIPDICPATLTNRLRKLEEAGIIIRRDSTVDKQSVTYALTERGNKVLPVIHAIKQFTGEPAR